ncbi:hypothetical protein GJU39_17390 [Pedobacter petrophilus]|uniref:Sigma-70 family RNA polymerase sigma factor n=1 Tax=Pedobacter petrophilus TaxID=1908241 RepID=A0A7K0G3S5_9SPHI|nr:hypothetical protein [Pedobacter petrophilus]MRX77859.1 hypothetical protein [Pedobacter petrophilus]
MPRYRIHAEEDIRKYLLLKDSNIQQVLYETYCPEVFGQFSLFCRERDKARELTVKAFEMARIEVENNIPVEGRLLLWLMKISRKISREYLLDYSVKKSSDQRCIRQLVLSEGFSTREAAGILGISVPDAIIRFRKELKQQH